MMEAASILGRLARRSFLSRLGAGAAALAVISDPPGSASASASAMAPAPTPASPIQAATPAGWQPARHTEDDWFDQPAAKHRLFFDSTEPDGFGQALAWARNFFEASASGYHLTDADSALIICARHKSTPFAFDDAIWTKYGAIFAERAPDFHDPKTKQPPTMNIYLASGYGDTLRNSGTTLDHVLKRGVRLAVCGMATRRYASMIAKTHNTSSDDVFKELGEHLVPNAHIVPAGIVAVSRAQERGYTLATVA